MTHDKIERSDVLNFFEYEKVRAAMRERVIELKRLRRVTELAAVHFVRFAFPPEAVRAFAASPVSLVVDHPAERGRAELSEETKAQLFLDLRG